MLTKSVEEGGRMYKEGQSGNWQGKTGGFRPLGSSQKTVIPSRWRTHLYTTKEEGEWRRGIRSRHFSGEGRTGREKGHNELALHEDKVENR